MERSKRESLNMRMKHGDNDETNKAQTGATMCAQGIGQRTTTKNRDSEDPMKTKDLQCTKTQALASTTSTLTLTCSPSVLRHFTHCWVLSCASCRQLNSCHCNHLLNF